MGDPPWAFPSPRAHFKPRGRAASDAFLAKFSLSAVSPLTCGATSPSPLNIPVGGSAEQVGDLVLTCTGGAAGPTAVTNIQLVLNATVASGTQPELLIDNPPPASQVPNVNLFFGSVNGTDSIVFSGVSFTVPGTDCRAHSADYRRAGQCSDDSFARPSLGNSFRVELLSAFNGDSAPASRRHRRRKVARLCVVGVRRARELCGAGARHVLFVERRPSHHLVSGYRRSRQGTRSAWSGRRPRG